MLAKYFGSVVPPPPAPELSDEALLCAGREILPAADAAMEEVEFHKALAAALNLSDPANRYIDTHRTGTAPRTPPGPWRRPPRGRTGSGPSSTTPSRRQGSPSC